MATATGAHLAGPGGSKDGDDLLRPISHGDYSTLTDSARSARLISQLDLLQQGFAASEVFDDDVTTSTVKTISTDLKALPGLLAHNNALSAYAFRIRSEKVVVESSRDELKSRLRDVEGQRDAAVQVLEGGDEAQKQKEAGMETERQEFREKIRRLQAVIEELTGEVSDLAHRVVQGVDEGRPSRNGPPDSCGLKIAIEVERPVRRGTDIQCDVFKTAFEI